MSIQELEAEALKLNAADQARLLHRLARALDDQEGPALTGEELEKRWTDFETSGDSGIEAAELRSLAEKKYGLG